LCSRLCGLLDPGYVVVKTMVGACDNGGGRARQRRGTMTSAVKDGGGGGR
jgi:hypothetical protein